MNLQDANLQFNEKTLSHILFYVFYLLFLRMYHNHFFHRGFDSVRPQSLSGESSVTCNLYLFDHDSSN